MSFGWGNLFGNQMVSFTDAQGSGFALNSGQSNPGGEQCMTKNDALTKYNILASNMSSYASNQLVPKGTWASGTVYQSAAYTESATKNNCPTYYSGSSIPLTAQAGQFTSTSSQADANNQAITYVQNNKQANANSNGSCTPTNTYYSAAYSESATRNNCPGGYTGGNFVTSAAASQFSSIVSQADANQQAVTWVQNNKQANATANGTCTGNPFTIAFNLTQVASPYTDSNGSINVNGTKTYLYSDGSLNVATKSGDSVSLVAFVIDQWPANSSMRMYVTKNGVIISDQSTTNQTTLTFNLGTVNSNDVYAVYISSSTTEPVSINCGPTVTEINEIGASDNTYPLAGYLTYKTLRNDIIISGTGTKITTLFHLYVQSGTQKRVIIKQLGSILYDSGYVNTGTVQQVVGPTITSNTAKDNLTVEMYTATYNGG